MNLLVLLCNLIFHEVNLLLLTLNFFVLVHQHVFIFFLLWYILIFETFDVILQLLMLWLLICQLTLKHINYFFPLQRIPIQLFQLYLQLLLFFHLLLYIIIHHIIALMRCYLHLMLFYYDILINYSLFQHLNATLMFLSFYVIFILLGGKLSR